MWGIKPDTLRKVKNMIILLHISGFIKSELYPWGKKVLVFQKPACLLIL